MRAIRAHYTTLYSSQRGDRGNIRLDQIPVPVPKYNEVLVRVKAAGTNPADWKITAGWPKTEAYGLPQFPMTLGMDFSGVVEACGQEAALVYKPGDPVFGKTNVTQLGAWAEYLVIPAFEVARKPEGLSHEGAASLPLAGRTAWCAMFFPDGVNIQPGETLLVQGGAGGVGSLALQMAKHCGARVIATSSARNIDFLKELGADEIIDYNAQRFEDVVGKVDAVLDTVGGGVMPRCYGVVKKGGRLVTVVDIPSPETAAEHGIRAAKVTGYGGSSQNLADLFEAGGIKPTVSDVYPLAEAPKVMTLLEEGHVRGKLVLQI